MLCDALRCCAAAEGPGAQTSLRSRSPRPAQLPEESARPPPWPWFRGPLQCKHLRVLFLAGLLHSIAQLGGHVGKEEHPEMAVVPLEDLQTANPLTPCSLLATLALALLAERPLQSVSWLFLCASTSTGGVYRQLPEQLLQPKHSSQVCRAV